MKFALGTTVITPAAHALLEELDRSSHDLICRHAMLEPGLLDEHDQRANAEALRHGDRLMSSYDVCGHTFWVITEADRSATTVLLPEDY